MSAEKLQTVLSGDPSITGLVFDRIYIAPVDQGTNKPFIAYEFDSDDPVRDLTGIADLIRQNWTITIYGDTFTQIDEIKMAIINVLSSESEEFFATFQSSDYSYDESASHHEFELSFTLIYK